MSDRCTETNPSHGWRGGQQCKREAGHEGPHLDTFNGGADAWEVAPDGVGVRIEGHREVPDPCQTNGYLAGAFTQYLFDACPDCGHTRMVHPGRHNPRVTSCLLCRLEGATR